MTSQVPALPASRMNNRQRGAETPSHGTGMSEAGRARLQEYRATRERQRGAYTLPIVVITVLLTPLLCYPTQRELSPNKTNVKTVLAASATSNAVSTKTETIATTIATAMITVTASHTPGMPTPHLVQNVGAKTAPPCECPTSAGTPHRGTNEAPTEVGVVRGTELGTHQHRGR